MYIVKFHVSRCRVQVGSRSRELGLRCWDPHGSVTAGHLVTHAPRTTHHLQWRCMDQGAAEEEGGNKNATHGACQQSGSSVSFIVDGARFMVSSERYPSLSPRFWYTCMHFSAASRGDVANAAMKTNVTPSPGCQRRVILNRLSPVQLGCAAHVRLAHGGGVLVLLYGHVGAEDGNTDQRAQ